MTFPSSLGVATYPPGASYGPRRMTDWEFVWLLQGNAEYRWGSKTVAVSAGSIVLCRPGAIDSFQWDRHQKTRHAFFHFPLDEPPAGWQEWPLVREPEDDDLLQLLFRHVLAWAGPGDPQQMHLTIHTMLAAFRTGQRTNDVLSEVVWPSAVEKSHAYIYARLEDDPAAAIPLSRLAQEACVTPEHLCRLFKSSSGRSPAETVRLARLDHAAMLLTRSNYAVGEIADLCGFASPFHFSRAFKRVYGLPPRELRRRIQSGETPPLPRLLVHHPLPSSRLVNFSHVFANRGHSIFSDPAL